MQIESSPVSHDFFRVLGVSPVLGRDFNGSDERVGAPPVVIVSELVSGATNWAPTPISSDV